MTGAALFESGIVCLALGCGVAGIAAALRTGAQARSDRLALRLAYAREAAFAEAARGLATAARHSVDAVRAELVRAVRIAAPAVDAVAFFEEHEGALVCVHAAGERLAYFAGSRLARDDARALPVRALAAGHRITLADGVRPLHPLDVAALAVPLALEGGRACVLALSARSALEGEHCERLVVLAEHASPAYAIAADREDDRRRAEYDGLTGLLTPRAFRQRLSAAIDRARVIPTARLALLFLDTDRFKRRAFLNIPPLTVPGGWHRHWLGSPEEQANVAKGVLPCPTSRISSPRFRFTCRSGKVPRLEPRPRSAKSTGEHSRSYFPTCVPYSRTPLRTDLRGIVPSSKLGASRSRLSPSCTSKTQSRRQNSGIRTTLGRFRTSRRCTSVPMTSCPNVAPK
jgi:hypothetical protein